SRVAHPPPDMCRAGSPDSSRTACGTGELSLCVQRSSHLSHCSDFPAASQCKTRPRAAFLSKTRPRAAFFPLRNNQRHSAGRYFARSVPVLQVQVIALAGGAAATSAAPPEVGTMMIVLAVLAAIAVV